MAEHITATENLDGLRTISEIKTGAYIWVVGALCLSAALVCTLYRYDSYLYQTKNKFIDVNVHRENRLSSATIPHMGFDKRTNGEFSTAVENLSK